MNSFDATVINFALKLKVVAMLYQTQLRLQKELCYVWKSSTCNNYSTIVYSKFDFNFFLTKGYFITFEFLFQKYHFNFDLPFS